MTPGVIRALLLGIMCAIVFYAMCIKGPVAGNAKLMTMVTTPAPPAPLAQTTLKKPGTAAVAVCMFGVVGRSIRRTWGGIVNHIIKPLRTTSPFLFDNVTLYVFNLDAGQLTIDGVVINSSKGYFSDLWEKDPLINKVWVEEATQSSVDKDIARKCNKRGNAPNRAHHSCRLRYDMEEHLPHVTRNAFRQMYSENRVAHFLRRHAHEFRLAVVTGPDFCFVKDLPLRELIIMDDEKRDPIYIPAMQEGEGFTNGFYVGQPRIVANVMSRYDEYEHYAHFQRDYEMIVKAAVERHNITRKVIDMPFCKVRANGKVWTGSGFPLNELHKCEKSPIG